MRNRISRLIVLLLSLLLISSATACTGPRSPEPSPASSSAVPALTMLWFGSPAEEELLRRQLAEFDVDVDLEVVAADQLNDRLADLITAGSAPDVVRITDLVTQRQQFNALHTSDPNDFLGGLDWPMKRGRDVIAIPYSAQTSLTWINAELFEKASAPLPTSESPWKTWEHMLTAAKQAAGATDQPLVAVDEHSPLAIDAFLWQSGVSYFDEKRGGVAWRIDEGSQALSKVADLVHQGALANTFSLDASVTPPLPRQQARALFEAGRIPVMLSDSSYQPPATMRAIAVPDPCERQCGPMPGADYLVSLGSHPSAEPLMTYLTMPAAQLQRAALGILPTQTAVLEEMRRLPHDQLPANARLAATELTLPPAAARATGFSPARQRADETTRSVLASLVDGTTTPQRSSELIGRGAAQAFAKIN